MKLCGRKREKNPADKNRKEREKSRDEQEKCAKERMELLLSIRKELKEKHASPKHSDRSFVTAQTVEEILTMDRIRVIFTGLPWLVDDYLEIIGKHLRLVLATLVMIKWTDWHGFKTAFLVPKDISERPRGDHLLPFSDLSFLSENFRDNFERQQHIFIPIVIVEDSHNSYPSEYRLPFLESKKVRGGGFGEVMRVRVERKYMKYTSGVYNGDSNQEVSCTI